MASMTCAHRYDNDLALWLPCNSWQAARLQRLTAAITMRHSAVFDPDMKLCQLTHGCMYGATVIALIGLSADGTHTVHACFGRLEM